jgi:antitoxin (DNA-binding transcriptional repressor) of toxin-antitoxin stability system
MKTVTIRDLRTRPKQVRQTLRREREAVLTANGRAVAVMIPVDSESIDQTLETLRRARALEALRAIRAGNQRMAPRDIDAVIAKTRRARSRAAG